MESQKFEELEEVDQEEGYVPEEQPKMKEYEKLLLAESNREMYEKAVKLIQYGCFSQDQKPEVDFSKYTKIDTEKKYKGLYTLYQDNETMDLVFICPLVENNKGDSEDERANMKPYAFDCITTEAMDAETFEMVSKAAKNNIRTSYSVGYVFAWVLYGIICAGALFTFLDTAFYMESQSAGFWASLMYAGLYSGALWAGVVIGLPVMLLLSMRYKQYKDK